MKGSSRYDRPTNKISEILSLFLLIGLAFSPLASAQASNAPSQGTAPSLATTPVFINEIHYDNADADVGEFIEIAGPAGTDLSGWQIVLYNGNGGASYNTTDLTGTIPDQQNGYGTLVFTYSGIFQNGSPDGMALVQGLSVVQFLSYEGTFVATNGPALGMTSVDIGVSEPSTTPIGFSLQLTGAGIYYEDFTWSGPSSSTAGAVNTGQTFGAAPTVDLMVVKTAPSVALVGDDLVYTIQVATATSISADGIVLTDTLPAGLTYVSDDSGITPAINGSEVVWDLGTLAGSSTQTVHVTASQAMTITAGTILTNTVKVSTTTLEDPLSNNSDTASTTILEVTPIATVRVGTPGEVYLIEGIVTVAPGTYNTNDREFTVQDDTGGIAIFHTTAVTGINLGDHVRVAGTFGAFTGQEQLSNTTIIKLGSETVPAPKPFTTAEVDVGATEGWLVVIQGVVSGLNDCPTGREFYVDDGSGGAYVYIDADTAINVCGKGVKNGSNVRIIGFSTQYNALNEIKPRMSSDVALIRTGPTLSKEGPVLVAPGAAFDYTFTLENMIGYDLTGLVVTEELPAGLTYLSGGTHAGGTVTWEIPALADQEVITFTLQVQAPIEEGYIFNDTYSVVASNYVTPTVGAPEATVVADELSIHHIQGSGDDSPFVDENVTVGGIITDLRYGDVNYSSVNGFFMQEPDPDANQDTSEGIFVYTGSSYPNLKVGDYVTLAGEVTEYGGMTEIDNVTSLVTDTTTTTIAPVAVDLPAPEGETLEPYEGMLVAFPEVLTVSQNYFLGRYGQVTLSADGRMYNPTNGNDLGDTLDLDLRRMIVLDDSTTAQNPTVIPYIGEGNTLRAGDTVNGLTGVIDYGLITSGGISHYRLQPVGEVNFTRMNERTNLPEDVGGNIMVASFNVLNYFNTIDTGPDICGPSGDMDCRGADSELEFERQWTKIITAMVDIDADIFGLMEIENNGDDADSAVQDLVNRLNAELGSDVYSIVPDPAFIGTDAIKVALIYKPDVVTLVGDSVSDDDPVHNRPPVAQTFQLKENGAIFTVVVNHFKSKGCDGATGDNLDTGQGCWNALRVEQAQALLDFVEELKTASNDRDVLVIGDLNSYGEEDPINTLTEGGLVNEVAKHVPAEERYSYVFDGLAGYLDHALATGTLNHQITDVTIWHINADEPSVIDYNLEFKPQDLWEPHEYRSSDHDPVIIGLKLEKLQYHYFMPYVPQR